MAHLNSLYLLCLFDGDCPSKGVFVKIGPTSTIHNLRNVIKTFLADQGWIVSADQLLVWHVSIKDVAKNAEIPIWLDNISNKRILELDTTFSTIFPHGVPTETIHFIIQRPNITLKIDAFDQEYRALRFNWSTMVETATLADLRKCLYNSYPEYSYDDQFLNISLHGPVDWPAKPDTIPDDESLRTILRTARHTSESSLGLYINTFTKNFSCRSYEEVCNLYGASQPDNPTLPCPFPPLTGIGSLPFNTDLEIQRKIQDYFLQAVRQRVRPFRRQSQVNVATKYDMVRAFVNHATEIFENDLCFTSQDYLSGQKGYGPKYTSIHPLEYPERTIGCVMVVRSRDDFKQAIVQNIAQMESAVKGRDFEHGILHDPSTLRSDVVENEEREMDAVIPPKGIQKVYGIVTDAETWAFLACESDRGGDVSFRMSWLDADKLDYYGNWKDGALSVFGHVCWLCSQMCDEIRAREVRETEETALEESNMTS